MLRKTNPPTQDIHAMREYDDDEYDEDTHVQWVCGSCKTGLLEVFYVQGGYHTYVRCPQCKKTCTVHDG